MKSELTVAAVSWGLRSVKTDGEFFGHFHDLVSSAHDKGAEIVVFPEFCVLELLGLEPDLAEHKVPEYLVQFDEALEEWLVRISVNSNMTIVGGSQFRRTPSGKVGNASITATPEGRTTVTFKNKLTDYERTAWRLEPGSGLKRLSDHRLGTLICYDSEFPEATRNLAEEGVQAVVVPAFTETQHGFQRVRWCCQARAIENQIYVIHSSLVGNLGREPVPSTYGSSAILAPSIEPFPASAILAETPLNEEGIAVTTLDFSRLIEAREKGDVRNWNDRYPSDWTVT
jgi:predicted amidohydrolase